MSLLLRDQTTGALWKTKAPTSELLLLLQSTHRFIDVSMSSSGNAFAVLLSNNFIYSLNLERNSFYRVIPPASSPVLHISISQLLPKNRNLILASTISEVFILDPCAFDDQELISVIPTSLPPSEAFFHPFKPIFTVLLSESLTVYRVSDCSPVRTVSHRFSSPSSSPFISHCFGPSNCVFILTVDAHLIAFDLDTLKPVCVFSNFLGTFSEISETKFRIKSDVNCSTVVIYGSNHLFVIDCSDMSSTATVSRHFTFPNQINDVDFPSSTLLSVSSVDGFRLFSLSSPTSIEMVYSKIEPLEGSSSAACKSVLIKESSVTVDVTSCFVYDLFKLIEAQKSQSLGQNFGHSLTSRSKISGPDAYSVKISHQNFAVSSQPANATSAGAPSDTRRTSFSATQTLKEVEKKSELSEKFEKTRRESSTDYLSSFPLSSSLSSLTTPSFKDSSSSVPPSVSSLPHYADLSNFLSTKHRLPNQHRSSTWKYLASLPLNVDAFRALQLKSGTSGGSRVDRIVNYLKIVIPDLKYLSENLSLGRLISHFARVFRSDIELFEFSLFWILNFFRGFLDYRPHLPIHLLSACYALLSDQCPKLVEFYSSLGLTTPFLFWNALSSVLSCWFPHSEWLELVDNFLLHNQLFFLCSVVALHKLVSTSVLGLSNKEQVVRFFNNESLAVSAADVIDCTKSIISSINPSTYFPSFVTAPFSVISSSSSVYPSLSLPPPFNADYALTEYENIKRSEQEYLHKELSNLSIAELAERVQKLQADSNIHLAQLDYLAEIEKERTEQLRVEEQFKLKTESERGAAERALRLKEVELKEEREIQVLQRIQKAKEDGLQYLTSKISDLRQYNNLAIQSKQDEEALRRAELEAIQRGIERDCVIIEQGHKLKLKNMADKAVKQTQDAHKELIHKLEVEDRQRGIRLTAAAERRRQTRVQAQNSEDQLKLEMGLLEAELERRSMERKVEAEARVREQEEKELLLTEQAVEINQKRLDLAREQEQIAMKEILDQRTQFLNELRDARRRTLEQEKARREMELEQQAVDLQMAERQIKKDLWETEVRDELRKVEQAEDQEEERLRQALIDFEVSRRGDRIKVEDIRRQQEELKSRLDFERELMKEAAAVRDVERERFDYFRRDLRTRTDTELAEITRRHQQALDILRIEREKKLLEMPEEERRRVYRELVPRLEEERKRLSERLTQAQEQSHQHIQSQVVASPSLQSTPTTMTSSVVSTTSSMLSSPFSQSSSSPLPSVSATDDTSTTFEFRPQRVVTSPSSLAQSGALLFGNVRLPSDSSTAQSTVSTSSTSIQMDQGNYSFLEQLRREAQTALRGQHLSAIDTTSSSSL
ncbi:hypothetical protein RCL1_006096 [Eukaryota sp. TZLM3-RCL]